MLAAVFLILQLDLGDDLIFVNYLLSLAIIVYFLLKPKADLIVTRKYLIHSKRSILKQLSKSNKYEIYEIKAIGCRGFHSDGWEIVDVFNGAGNNGGYSNTLMMKFKDKSTKTIEIAVSKKKLDRIVKIVDRRIQRRANTK
ncbi:hypothetical protein MATR_32520 [Marivirga tractuosa]|uniref:DUF304 domain-containing protein n=1 Tax=Marivirga tractuosa (strain ATCC 23168 / DSM 4126 / NBRC 15989 / NCIMB 1408 / VKM B-1430 / H-43) TaxID=643867 RepID=E4TSV8_MARTH|nr:hypothetical protein [Marivirga tractuosa]ADR22899.1 hypothetical protein Ftrac_2923 [Marivirga tractuosa DSM 4126]BDD16427.1 hypothetical protein MATR_32520 [Marivirga tractuosa]